jgi:glutathione S-transferase
MSVTLHGYKYSVYAWIARMALHEKGVPYQWIEVDPFADDVSAAYRALHPFVRVPTLVDGEFALYETGAITRYVDDAFDGPRLQPNSAKDCARVSQIISIIDSYAYWPLVRQVFAHGVIGPRIGRPSDAAEVARGLDAAPRILHALNDLATGAPFLVGDGLSLADIHLAPMIAYFTAAEDGRALFDRHDKLPAWWAAVSTRPAFVATRPQLPEPPA